MSDFAEDLAAGLKTLDGPEWDTWANKPDGWTDPDQEHLWRGMGVEDWLFATGLDSSPFFRRENRLGLAIAIMCADVKARDIAKVDFDLWKLVGDGWAKVQPKEHALAMKLARRPNKWLSWGEFWRMTVMHLELAQNAYIWLKRNRGGDIEEWIPLPPARCRVRIDNDGDLWYEVGAGTQFERAQLGGRTSLFIREGDMIHLRGRLADGLMGMSNVELGNPIFDLLNQINRYQRELFGNDGKQPVVFETDQIFEDNAVGNGAFNRLRDQLKSKWRKAKAFGEPLLLDAGIKAKALALNSKDAMTVETYNQQVLRVCALMQTPPHKIYHYDAVKYNNQASADNQYANDCLVPLVKNIEEKVRNAVLVEEEWDEYWPEFNRMQLVAGDPISMAKMIEVGMRTGTLEINEVRTDYFGRAPLPGGDVRLIPTNLWMVDRDNKVVVGTQNGQGDPNADDDANGNDDDQGNEDDESGDEQGERSARLTVVK